MQNDQSLELIPHTPHERKLRVVGPQRVYEALDSRAGLNHRPLRVAIVQHLQCTGDSAHDDALRLILSVASHPSFALK